MVCLVDNDETDAAKIGEFRRMRVKELRGRENDVHRTPRNGGENLGAGLNRGVAVENLDAQAEGLDRTH